MSNDKVSKVEEVTKLYGTLVYVCVQEPVRANQEYGAKPDEWKASIAITDKKQIKAFKDYAKSLKTMTSIKEVEKDDFEGIYKCPPPEDAGDEIWVVTFRKSTMTKLNGEPIKVEQKYAPKVFEKQGKIIKDITQEKLGANGSKGAISIDTFRKKDGTGSMYLKSVLVTELIEYTKKSKTIGSEWEDEDDDSEVVSSTQVTEVATKTTKTSTKPSRPVTNNATDDLDDDIPF
jgi:hypothetical protein